MAQVINGHWTNDSAKAFLFRIAFDFVAQLERLMDAEGITAKDLAQRLKVSKGRVSQIMNSPGNLTLKTIVEWARALDLKVAIVAYDDGDMDNDNGPVNPQIFTTCWERAGRPTDFFTAGMTAAASSGVEIDARFSRWESRAASDCTEPDDAEAWTGSNMMPPNADQGVESDAGTNADHV